MISQTTKASPVKVDTDIVPLDLPDDFKFELRIHFAKDLELMLSMCIPLLTDHDDIHARYKFPACDNALHFCHVNFN